MPIRRKLLLVFLVLSLAPPTLVGFIAFENGRRAIEDGLGTQLELRAARVIETLDREAESFRRSVETWTGLELMQDILANDPDGRVSAFLIEQARSAETISLALVTSAEGKVVAASQPDRLGQTMTTLTPVGLEGRVCRDEPAGPGAAEASRLTCTFAIRAAFDEKKIIGQLHVTFDLCPTVDRLHFEGETDVTPVKMFLVRQDGVVISGPETDPEWSHGANLVAAGSQAARRAAQGGKGFLVEPLGEGDHLVGYAHSAGVTGWLVLVGQDVDDAFAPVHRLRLVVIGLAAVITALVVVLSFALAKRVTSPVLQLTRAAQEVAAGNLEPALPPRSQDEIGDLIDGFAHMAGELRTQRAQLVEKDYLDSIVSHMVDGLIVVDAEGKLLTTNPALYEIAGQPPATLLGEPAATLFAEGEAGFRDRVLEPVRRDGEVRGVELGLLDGTGRSVPVSLSAGTLPRGTGGVGAIVCMLTDITRMKDAEAALVRAREEAEAGAQAKARFLATMSHEIRTPLNGIIGMMELLVDSRLEARQRDYAETAQRSGEALLAIVGDILDYSKLEADRLELESLDFDPRATLEGVADVLAPRARDKGLELAVACDPALPARVRGDERRLRQVLLNLGSNAVKFTSQGHVILRAIADRGQPSRIRFEVEDTGIGIPPEGRDRLFRPFSQVDASTTRRYGGTGLGLAISTQLVELMGGEIGVATEEGRGSTFWASVRLPAVEGAVVPEETDLSGLHVLVVDDNETNRHLVCEMLDKWGCLPTPAADGWEALQILRAAGENGAVFELALVDFQMPEMDGGQLAAEIKKDARLASLPLVLLTSVPQQAETARQMGFEACLAKPIKGAALRQVVESTVRTPPPGEREPVPVAPSRAPAETRGRVLVVDDDPASLKVALELIRQRGCECDAVASGEAALEAVDSEAYDLVFMDCQMPEMDGYETTRRIRDNDRNREGVVIVAMTGDVLGEDRARCLEAGMDDHVAKPVRGADFERMLARYLPAPA